MMQTRSLLGALAVIATIAVPAQAQWTYLGRTDDMTTGAPVEHFGKVMSGSMGEGGLYVVPVDYPADQLTFDDGKAYRVDYQVFSIHCGDGAMSLLWVEHATAGGDIVGRSSMGRRGLEVTANGLPGSSILGKLLRMACPSWSGR